MPILYVLPLDDDAAWSLEPQPAVSPSARRAVAPSASNLHCLDILDKFIGNPTFSFYFVHLRT